MTTANELLAGLAAAGVCPGREILRLRECAGNLSDSLADALHGLHKLDYRRKLDADEHKRREASLVRRCRARKAELDRLRASPDAQTQIEQLRETVATLESTRDMLQGEVMRQRNMRSAALKARRASELLRKHEREQASQRETALRRQVYKLKPRLVERAKNLAHAEEQVSELRAQLDKMPSVASCVAQQNRELRARVAELEASVSNTLEGALMTEERARRAEARVAELEAEVNEASQFMRERDGLKARVAELERLVADGVSERERLRMSNAEYRERLPKAEAKVAELEDWKETAITNSDCPDDHDPIDYISWLSARVAELEAENDDLRARVAKFEAQKRAAQTATGRDWWLALVDLIGGSK